MKSVKITIAFVFLGMMALTFYRSLSPPNWLFANSSGPPPGRTRAPGEGDCLLCHFSYPPDHESGGVFLKGLPESYTPGQAINFTVTAFQDGTGGVRQAWGFQLTTLDGHDAFAGTLVVTDPTNTQVVTGVIENQTRHYLEQTTEGTFLNPAGDAMATWSMAWIPPDKDVGPVIFYVAANAANGDGMQLDDYIFFTQQVILGPPK